jgi:hypothetical protein
MNEWDLALTIRGIPVDLRELSLDAYIFDDGKEIAGLRIIECDVWQGTITFRLSTAVLRPLGRYSTWRLYERDFIAGEIMRAGSLRRFLAAISACLLPWSRVVSRACRGFTSKTNISGDGTEVSSPKIKLDFRSRPVVLNVEVFGISLPTTKTTWGELEGRTTWGRIVSDRWGRYGENSDVSFG